jgi:hypothetical protein
MKIDADKITYIESNSTDRGGVAKLEATVSKHRFIADSVREVPCPA